METDSNFDNPYLRQFPWLLAVMAAGVAAVVLGFGLGTSDFATILQVSGLVVGTLSGFLALGWYVVGRSLESSLEAFRGGQSLASWTIEAEQWNVFAAEMRGGLRLLAFLLTAIFGFCGVLLGALINSDGDPNGKPIMYWSAGGSVVLWFLVNGLLALGWQSVRHPVNVVYGVAAGVFHRKIISWGTTGHTLIEASLDSEARRIVLVTDVQNQHGNTRVTRRLPFPEGAIDEAESLVARYNQIVADRTLS